MKTITIVQTQMGSTRFPDKVMHLINGVPMIERLLNRLARSKKIDQIILATANDARNQPLTEHVRQLGFTVYQG